MARAIGKPHGHNAIVDLAETEITLLGTAVRQVFGNDTARIEESQLGQRKRDVMLDKIGSIFCIVPLECRLPQDMADMPYWNMGQ